MCKASLIVFRHNRTQKTRPLSLASTESVGQETKQCRNNARKQCNAAKLLCCKANAPKIYITAKRKEKSFVHSLFVQTRCSDGVCLSHNQTVGLENVWRTTLQNIPAKATFPRTIYPRSKWTHSSCQSLTRKKKKGFVVFSETQRYSAAYERVPNSSLEILLCCCKHLRLRAVKDMRKHTRWVWYFLFLLLQNAWNQRSNNSENFNLKLTAVLVSFIATFNLAETSTSPFTPSTKVTFINRWH